MSIDHNRIKVADLETNEANRILVTNGDGVLEFRDVEEVKTDSYADTKVDKGGYSGTAQDLDDKITDLESKSEDKNFLYTQNTPSTLWNITHNLNKKPSVTVVDSAGTETEGEMRHINSNQLTIAFNAAFSGEATLN